MYTEFHRNAVQRLEHVREQQQLTFGVDGRVLYGLDIPRAADFESVVSFIGAEEARRTDHLIGLSVMRIAHDKRHRTEAFTHVQRSDQPLTGLIERRDGRVPKLLQPVIDGHGVYFVPVLRAERFQSDVLTRQCDRLD